MAKRKCKRYYYVPSTYKGRKFKRKGKCGGAYRGCGRICGGNLDDLAPRRIAEAMPAAAASAPVDIPVEPAQVEENILGFPKITDEMIERARQVIALAEATGKAQPITKKEAGIWSGIKNLGSKVWSGVKSVASNPYVQGAVKAAVPFALGALAPAAMPYVQKAADYLGQNAYDFLGQRYKSNSIANQTAAENARDIGANTVALAKNLASDAGQAMLNTGKNALKKVGSWFGWGSGYRAGAYRGMGRKRHLRKGSPEAKAYMAMLRRMRGKKNGKGIGGAYRAGAYRGMGHLRKGSSEAKAYMAMLRSMRGKKKRTSKKGGMFRGVSLAQIKDYYLDAKKAPNQKVNIEWTGRNGKVNHTKVSANSLKGMLRGTTSIQNFYKFDANGNARSKDFRSKFLKAHYGKSRWPYKMMGEKRREKHLKHLNSMERNGTRSKILRYAKYWSKRANKDLARYLIKKETGIENDIEIDELIKRYAPQNNYKLLTEFHPLRMKRKGRKKINKQQKEMLKNLFQ